MNLEQVLQQIYTWLGEAADFIIFWVPQINPKGLLVFFLFLLGTAFTLIFFLCVIGVLEWLCKKIGRFLGWFWSLPGRGWRRLKSLFSGGNSRPSTSGFSLGRVLVGIAVTLFLLFGIRPLGGYLVSAIRPGSPVNLPEIPEKIETMPAEEARQLSGDLQIRRASLGLTYNSVVTSPHKLDTVSSLRKIVWGERVPMTGTVSVIYFSDRAEVTAATPQNIIEKLAGRIELAASMWERREAKKIKPATIDAFWNAQLRLKHVIGEHDPSDRSKAAIKAMDKTICSAIYQKAEIPCPGVEPMPEEPVRVHRSAWWWLNIAAACIALIILAIFLIPLIRRWIRARLPY